MSLVDVISVNLPILRELRDRLGQLELAERVGVSRRTIARLENGEVSDPGVELMSRIAAELGVTLSLLIEDELIAVTMPLPKDVVDRLESDDGAEALSAMVRGARDGG